MEDDDEVYEARLRERIREMERADQESSERVVAHMEELRKEKPAPLNLSRLGARTFGTAALLDVGCVVWEKQDPLADYDRRGGMIVEITDDVDFTEDGEVIRKRAFKCYDYYRTPETRQAWCVLDEERVDLDVCTPAQLSRLRNAVRRICKHVGQARGVMPAWELELVTIAARLAAVIGQRWS